MKRYKSIYEDIKIPLEIGDETRIGKFKSKKAIIKGYGKDDNNKPTVKTDKGEIPLFKFRISKLMPVEESKQVGIVYHLTSLIGLLSILKTNQLQGAINGISLTRNKFAYRFFTSTAGNKVTLILDGDKLSNRYKIKPYRDTTGNYGDEQEERIHSRLVKNIDEYLLGINLNYPNNWIVKDREAIQLNRIMGLAEKDYDFSIEDFVNFIKSKYKVKINIIE